MLNLGSEHLIVGAELEIRARTNTTSTVRKITDCAIVKCD